MLLTLSLGLLGCSQETSLSTAPLEMGRAPMRRVNRDEFDRTLTALLGTDTKPSRLLPQDEEAYDFLTIADALTISPLHIETWDEAIDEALTEFFGAYQAEYVIEMEGGWVGHTGGRPDGFGYYNLQGSSATNLELPFEGLYEISLTGWAPNGDSPTVRVSVDGEALEVFNFFSQSRDFPQTLGAEIYLEAGNHTIELTQRSNVAGIDNITVRGPLDLEPTLSETYHDVVFCSPRDRDTCVDEVLAGFVTRAWRRPATADDVAWARGLYNLGAAVNGSFEEGLRVAFKGAMLAPEFVFRVERSPELGDPPLPLDSHEIASRLSYFLWSSGPDDTLLELAAEGELTNPGVVAEQARRMLADRRSSALVDTFAAQWLDIDVLEDFEPDESVYRDFDDELKVAIIDEMRFIADRFVGGRINYADLLMAETTEVNPRLAQHYKMPITGEGWQRVSLDATPRRGLLGTAGWLMSHSYPGAPSVVRRGKWVLGRMLCDSPPPPPPDVDQDLELSQFVGSVREQEEIQRSGEPCHTCHKVMDPIGFAMGSFDATGGERVYDELGARVDTQVVIEGRPVSGVQDLAFWVAGDSRLPRCIVEQTFHFALGRPPVEADDRNLDDITRAFVNGGGTFPALVQAMVTHDVFLHRADLSDDLEDLQ